MTVETSGADATPETPLTRNDADGSEESESAETASAHEPVEVGLERSVRYGRIILTSTGIFAVLGMIAALLFPVVEKAEYTLGQAVGLTAVVGAIVGLTIGALFALILGIVAKRSRGAALAVQTDVK